MHKPKRREVDMHIHSQQSDGDCTIGELVKKIKNAGLKAAVLTDHDKIDNCNAFIDLCSKNDIDTMTGIEISTSYFNYAHSAFLELHILGYGFDLKKIKLKDGGLCFSHNAKQRNLDMLEAINETKNKYPDVMSAVSEKDIAELFSLPHPLISRYWVAKYIAHQITKSRKEKLPELVKKIWEEIKHGNTHATPRRFVHPQEAIQLITASDGAAVWAHPTLTLEKLKKRLGEKKALSIFLSIAKELKDYGIVGVETFTSYNKKKDVAFMKNICQTHNLSPYFGGSDYHGDKTPKLYLGKGGISYDKFLNIKR